MIRINEPRAAGVTSKSVSCRFEFESDIRFLIKYIHKTENTHAYTNTCILAFARDIIRKELGTYYLMMYNKKVK